VTSGGNKVMSTTSLFIELLLTGVHTFLGLTLLILCFFGFDWINLERIKDSEAVLAILLLPIVYPIGIFVDYIADDVLRPWEIKIRQQFIQNNTQSAMRLLSELKDPSLAYHLGYIRSKIRISRSSTLNFALMTVTGIAFTVIRCGGIPNFPFWRALIFEVFFGLSLTLLSFFAWRRFNRSFFRWVAQFYNPNLNYSDHGLSEGDILEAPLSESEVKTV
jgi:hypothetical protein